MIEYYEDEEEGTKKTSLISKMDTSGIFRTLIPVIVLFSIIGLVTWQFGIFNMGGTAVTASGFSRVKPQLAATVLGEEFRGVFTNGAGTTIDVEKAVVYNQDTDKRCIVNAIMPRKVSPGDNFEINADTCGRRPVGDPISMDVSIEYELTIGRTTSTHTDRGVIRGPVETISGDGKYDYTKRHPTTSRSYPSYRSSRSRGYYKAFDFGSWWVVIGLMGLVIVADACARIKGHIDSNLLYILAVYGVVFIIASQLIIIFGLHFHLNGLANYEFDYPDRIRYAWAIEAAMYLLVGGICLYYVDNHNKKAEVKGSITSIVAAPVSWVFTLSAMSVYTLNTLNTVYKPASLAVNLVGGGWLIEAAVLGAASIYGFKLLTTELQRTAKLKELSSHLKNLKNLLTGVGSIYLLILALIFMSGFHEFIYLEELDYTWVNPVILIAAGGAAMLGLAGKIKKRRRPRKKPEETTEV
ncbi:MAG: hypothetical protein ABH950_04425 [Candidatus Altiarchaeota archaeon]